MILQVAARTNRKIERLFICAALTFSAATVFVLSSCSPAAYPGPVETITVAYSPFESTALLWIAQDRQFLGRNGIEIRLQRSETGAGALDAALKGEADIAVGTAEFPVVIRAFRQERMRVIASVDKANFIYIIARKDRGIEEGADLKGKRVGTTVGTVAEFYLGRYLDLAGLGISDITLVDLKTPESWIEAVARGDVDAVATAQPYASAARDRLGADASFWPAQRGQLLYGLVVSSDEWLAGHSELAGRFLNSLSQAEDYLVRNPAEAKAIVQKGLDLDPAYIEAFWSQNQFGLSLDQSLITAMEDQARWMISSNLTTGTQAPDFLEYISEDVLKGIRPEVVNITR